MFNEPPKVEMEPVCSDCAIYLCDGSEDGSVCPRFFPSKEWEAAVKCLYGCGRLSANDFRRLISPPADVPAEDVDESTFVTSKQAADRLLSGFKAVEDAANSDPVSAPSHYAGDGKVTCKDALASMMAKAQVAPKVAYWWGCAFKYVWRWPLKNGKQDIDKAIECLKQLGEELA